MVALAGPIANLLLAIAFAALVRLFPASTLIEFFYVIAYANVLLLVFNLVPIPPLDGSKILYAILPDSARGVRDFLERYSFILLMVFVFFLFELIVPVIGWVMKLLIG